MQRIVHGHFADPNSTRDITGITPKEFEIIVEALRYYYRCYDIILSATPEDRLAVLKAVHANEMFSSLNPSSAEKIEEELKKSEDTMIENNNLVYEILTAINKPYPGAEY